MPRLDLQASRGNKVDMDSRKEEQKKPLADRPGLNFVSDESLPPSNFQKGKDVNLAERCRDARSPDERQADTNKNLVIGEAAIRFRTKNIS
jgi:hypothetical protein